MIVEIKKGKEVDLKLLIVKAGVRYWEDSNVDGMDDTKDGKNVPCKIGDLWCPQIEIETGKIVNWRQGTSAEIHYKVADCCGWELQDESGAVVLSAEDGYVPNTLAPEFQGFGDYIIMNIDENGQIADWVFVITDFIFYGYIKQI